MNPLLPKETDKQLLTVSAVPKRLPHESKKDWANRAVEALREALSDQLAAATGEPHQDRATESVSSLLGRLSLLRKNDSVQKEQKLRHGPRKTEGQAEVSMMPLPEGVDLYQELSYMAKPPPLNHERRQ